MLRLLVIVSLQVKKKVRSSKKKNHKPKKTSQPSEPTGTGQDQIQEADSVASTEVQAESDIPNANALVYNALHASLEKTNLGPIDDAEVVAEEGHHNDIAERDNDEFEDKGDHEEDDSESESEEEEEEEMQTKEETLDVTKCVRMFADNTILHNYCWLLKNYLHNTAAMNYYIVRMLQRICDDLMMEPMLYQVHLRS